MDIFNLACPFPTRLGLPWLAHICNARMVNQGRVRNVGPGLEGGVASPQGLQDEGGHVDKVGAVDV